MRRLVTATLMIALLVPGAIMAIDQLDIDPGKNLDKPSFLGYVPNRFIVVLKDEVTVNHEKDATTSIALSNLSGFAELAQKYEVPKLRPQFPGSDAARMAQADGSNPLARNYKVWLGSSDLEEAMADYAALPDVDHVEPIGVHTVYAAPNDPYYDDNPGGYAYDQWHYFDTYGIEGDAAWDLEAGDQSVIVGDLDIGTMYNHGDLGGSNPPGPNDASTNGNIWVNTNEIPGNGIDDDGNGYVDDIIGWDFVDRTDWYSYPCIDNDCGGADNDPSDGDGHGTHTAGTIAAITNNGYAVAGVAGGFGDGTFSGGGNGVKIIPCRIGYVLDYWIYGATGVVIMDYVAEAMYYMAELKIDGWNVAAINCSFGTSNSGGLSSACTYLINQDVVVCVAAGNSNSSAADYLGSRGDCLDVGATDSNGNPASFSNYGSWVDIAAPGVEVLNTITDPSNPTVDYVAPLDGTSMACPHVAGVVGLLESYNPSLSATDKINIITDVANTKSYNMSKNVGVGIVDAFKCLQAAGGGCDLAADFSGTPTSGCANLTVNFTDLSTGTGIDGWDWTFGDGGTSTAQNPSHTYTSAGTYNVSLTVSSSSQACNDAVTKTGYITVSAGPTASFTGSPTSGTEPLTVDFTNGSTNATSYDWDFGDGGSSTATNPSYTYNSAGTYTVTLTAYNACGSDQQVRVDYITVNPCVTPTAGFVGSPTSGDYPLTVDFTDQSTGAASYDWTFGDGGTSTAANPSHTYTAAGTYTVTQTVTNACGSDQLVRTDYITVTEPPPPPPTADFVGTPTSGDYPLTVDFTDLSTDGPTSWSWDFGDGGTSTLQNPSYTYTAAGSYTVSLTATNAYGSDVETKLDYITVTELTTAEQAYALSDIPTYGTIAGSYLSTYASDNNYEVLAETISDNHPRKTTSWLEHKWDFSVGGGTTVTFYVEAYRTANSEGDDFTFAYSTDNVNFVDMVTVASATEQVYSYSLPANTSGTVWVRVLDGDRSWGNSTLDELYVDQMYIEYESTPGPPTADFAGAPTTGDYPLEVSFTDLSTGSPTSWSWTFGDGGTSTAQNPSYTYNAAGTYSVSLTASNAYGSDAVTKTNYITVTEPGVDESHVANMVVGRAKSGPNYYGTCAVTIYDQANQPLSGATVYVTYGGPTSGSLNGTTGTDGTVSFSTTSIKKPTGEWCFTVTDVTHVTHSYDAGSNAVTQACESGWIYSTGDPAAMSSMVPTEYGLTQNYPNPFNPTTEIAFSLPQASHVSLTIYNVLGQQVATVADGPFAAGSHVVVWDASDQGSGVYFYRLTSDLGVISKKMMLLK